MAIILWVALCFCIRKRSNMTVELDSAAFFAQRIVHALTDLLSFILNSFFLSPFFLFLVMCQLFKCSFYFDIHSRHEFRRQWKSSCWRWKKKEKKQEKQNVTCILQTMSTTDRERRREIKNAKWRKILTCNNWTGRERVDLSKVD